MIAWLLGILKPLGTWVATQVLGQLLELAKAIYAKWKRTRDAAKTSDQNDKRVDEALEKGDDDEIKDSSGDLLSGRKP